MSKSQMTARLAKYACRTLAVLTILCRALPAMADQSGNDASRLEPPAVPHPILSADTRWAGVLLIGVVAMFVLAAVVGPVVRAIAPDDHLSHGDGH
jgi:hypothetical protein